MIKLREDFRYFTHKPGKESVVPLSTATVIAYPAKLVIGSCEIELPLTGPVKEFTHLLNIEKKRVEVFGTYKEGYAHFVFFAKGGSVFLKYSRGVSFTVLVDGKKTELTKGKILTVAETETISVPPHIEKVSFGCTKKPLLEKGIDTRTRLYALAQMMPQRESAQISDEQLHVLLTDLLAPQTTDKNFLGVQLPTSSFDKFSLFSTFFHKTKQALVNEENDVVILLPNSKKLPVAGRAVSLITENFSVTFLWRKGKVVRVEITPLKDCCKQIQFPGFPKKYRIKHRLNERGNFHDAAESLQFKKNKILFVDRISY